MKSDISENLILYDWVTISCKDDDPQVWVKLLQMESIAWEELDHGRNGYCKALFYGSISILYDGNEGMGSCLDMSGQGCRTFEELGSGDFDGLFKILHDNPTHFHMTRLDVAFDDHTGILDTEQLFEDTRHREYISKFRLAEVHEQLVDGSKKSVMAFQFIMAVRKVIF